MAIVSEVERVLDAEVVEEDSTPSWEFLISEWADAGFRVFKGQLRQARAAANVTRYYGSGAMQAFANEVGASKSTVYDYARAYVIYGHLYEGDSGRLENSGCLTISHLIEASYAEDPVQMLERAEDEGMTSRQIKKERNEPPPEANVETIEMICCAKCGEVYPMSEATIWRDPA